MGLGNNIIVKIKIYATIMIIQEEGEVQLRYKMTEYIMQNWVRSSRAPPPFPKNAKLNLTNANT